MLVNVAGFHQMRWRLDETTGSRPRGQPQRAVLLCRAALPHLLEVGGNIVNVAIHSQGGGRGVLRRILRRQTRPRRPDRALAVEYTRERLRVNAICPGGMLTAQVTEFASTREDADWELIVRIASPAWIHGRHRRRFKTIAFPRDDDAAAVHGAVYRVDNGKGRGLTCSTFVARFQATPRRAARRV